MTHSHIRVLALATLVTLAALPGRATVINFDSLTGPVALLVDDLQWIDPDSAAALAALVQRAAGDRLLVATAYRPLASSNSTVTSRRSGWPAATDCRHCHRSPGPVNSVRTTTGA